MSGEEGRPDAVAVAVAVVGVVVVVVGGGGGGGVAVVVGDVAVVDALDDEGRGFKITALNVSCSVGRSMGMGRAGGQPPHALCRMHTRRKHGAAVVRKVRTEVDTAPPPIGMRGQWLSELRQVVVNG